MASCSPSRCASADRSAPGGCEPWSGWSSCCGSPSSTIERVAPRHRQHVGERHLARLVDEEDIDHLVALPRRPQPGGAGGDVEPADSHPVLHFVVVSSDRHERVVEGVGRVVRRAAPPARRRRPHAARTVASRLPMTLWLLAVIPIRFPRAREPGDHVGAGVRLSRPRRALDGEGAGVERLDQAAGRLELRFIPSRAERHQPAWPTGGGRRRSRSRPARHGPGASIPWSATHSPSRRSAARCSLSGKMFIGTRASGCTGSSVAGTSNSTVEPASSTTRFSARTFQAFHFASGSARYRRGSYSVRACAKVVVLRR